MSSAEHPWQRLTTALAGRLDAPQIADLLWMAQLLAPQINRQPEPLLPPPTELLRPAQPAAAEARGSSATRTQAPSAGAEPSASPPAERSQPVALLEPATGAGPLPADAPRVSVAEAGLLQRPRRIGRALAPLNRPVAAGPARQLDVVATVEAIARARAEGRPWQPVLRPRLEPWLSLHLVFDAHPSMALWQQLRRELPRSLRQQVRWRDLRIWSAHRPSGAALVLRVGHGCPCASGQLRRPGGRDLVLVVSDAIASGWRDGTMAQLLGHWASQQPVLLLQVLPSRLWSRTGLGQRQTGWVKSRRVMQPNRQLRWQPLESDPSWLQPLSTKPPSGTLNLPLTSLDPGDLAAMAQLLSAGPGNNLLAVRLELKPPAPAPEPQAQADRASAAMQPDSAAIEQQLSLFLFSASPQARRLLALLSFAPVITLPVVRLIQQQQVAGSGPAQIAEVLFSGLFRNLVPVQPPRGAALVPPDRQQLCFVDEKLRPRLRQGLRLGEARAVFDAVSAHVAANLNLSLDHFEALLRQRTATESQEHRQLLEAFARVSPQCLRGLGRGYEQLADAIEESWADPTPKGDSAFPNPELLPFETAWLEEIELQPISFTTSTLIRQSRPVWRALGGSPDELIREDRKAKAWASFERLQAAGPLDLIMVWIPAGSFVMGSPYNEPEHVVNEGPQHQVTLEGFLIGQTPITQAQWRTVAQWQPQQGERWGRELAPNPSRFQNRSAAEPIQLLAGEANTDQRPVEWVSWHDAMEFCSRLSQRTGLRYSLPSEAQWEYACRAGSTTPFHFGTTLTTDLANYNGNYTYANGPKGVARHQTTPVTSFPANAWGLHDMHGNVWEWCLDHWHSNYAGAPTDGRAWLIQSELTEKKGNQRRLLRGGSWGLNPGGCRSAYRYDRHSDSLNKYVGFRVCCSPQDLFLYPETL